MSYEHDVDFESSETFPEPATGAKHKYTARVSPRHLYTSMAGLKHKHAARLSAQHRYIASLSPTMSTLQGSQASLHVEIECRAQAYCARS